MISIGNALYGASSDTKIVRGGMAAQRLAGDAARNVALQHSNTARLKSATSPSSGACSAARNERTLRSCTKRRYSKRHA